MKKRYLLLFVPVIYYLTKFCYIHGYTLGLYDSVFMLNQVMCRDRRELNMYKYGTEGECSGVYIPPDDVLIKSDIIRTFTTFP